MKKMKAAVILVVVLALIALVNGSSHSEAPGTSTMPQTDITDLYAFVSYETSRENWVTLIANWNPRQSPYGGPNYYPLDNKFYYEIHVDQTGDGVPEITYQFVFHSELANNGTGLTIQVGSRDVPVALKAIAPITNTDQDGLNFLEYYRLNVVTPTSSQTATVSGSTQNFFVKPFDYIGTKTFSNYTDYAHQYIYNIDIPNCATAGRVFVGQRKESFHVNLGKVFDLIDFVPIDGSTFPGGINQSSTNNAIQDTNIVSIALEVPTSCIIGNTSSVIGVWAASRSIRGGRQRSRLGNPLINELLTGLKDKDKFNRRRPSQDGRLLNYVLYPSFPAIVNALFRSAINSVLGTNFNNIAPTNLPRDDLVAALLTGVPGLNHLQDTPTRYVEQLRLNTSIAPTPRDSQNSLGVIAGDNAGYPNGRRVGDDVVDIVLRVAMGVLCHANLGVCSPSQAVVGTAALTDGAPVNASNFDAHFPYVKTPLAGSDF